MLYRPENEEAAIAKTTVAAAVSLCEAVEKTAGIACGMLLYEALRQRS